MTRLRVLLYRLTGLVRRGSLERDLDEELAHHLQLETAENVRRGMTPAAALRRRRSGQGDLSGNSRVAGHPIAVAGRAFRLSDDAAQSGPLAAGDPLPDLGDRRELSGLQLD